MFALISFALAADTVVYSGGDAAAALARVTSSTGSAEQMKAVSVAELMAGRPPSMVGGGTIALCGGTPSSPDTLRQSLTLAEGAIKYMEFGSARAALDAAIRDLGCLQVPVDAAQASRSWYLRGIVNAASGDQAASREDFRRARLFAPSMVWDENFAPNARATFDAIAAESKSVSLVPLTVLPAPVEGSFRLDGRPVQLIDGHVGVSAGDHYVQIGDAPAVTLSLHVDGNTPPMLVLPALVGPDVLSWAGDGETRSALSAVLVSALGNEGVVYVVNPDVVWRVRLGGSAWDLVTLGSKSKPVAVKTPKPSDKPLPTEPVAAVVEPSGKKSALGPVLIGVGAGVGLAGGIVAVLGYTDAVEARQDAVDHGTTDAIRARYNRDEKRLIYGTLVGSVGAAALATGIVVKVAF